MTQCRKQFLEELGVDLEPRNVGSVLKGRGGETGTGKAKGWSAISDNDLLEKMDHLLGDSSQWCRRLNRPMKHLNLSIRRAWQSIKVTCLIKLRTMEKIKKKKSNSTN